MTAGLVLAVAYAIAWLPMFVLRVETMAEGLRVYEGGERITVWLAPLVISLHVTAACVVMSFAMPPPGRLTAAAALFAAAFGLWLWGRVMIGPPRTKRPAGAPPLRFRRDGAFGIVRHPLYASYLAAALAPVVATLQPLLMLSFAACFAVLALRAIQDERRLRAQLGTVYDDYCREVKRLIPFLW